MRASDRSDLISTTPEQRRATVLYSSAVAAMIATIAAAGGVMRQAVRMLADSPDARFPTHYSVGASMPYPAIIDHDGGWAIFAIFIAFIVLLAIESLVAANALARTGRRGPLFLVAGLVVVLIAMTFFPVTFSIDSYAYAAFGRLLGVHGLNPYLERLVHRSSLHDPVMAQLGALLGTPLPDENYGPLWTWLSAGLAVVSQPGGLALVVWMQRAAGAASLVVAALGLLRLHRASPPAQGTRRTALFALHPLALYESAAAGHNDMLMIAPAVWAFAVVESSPLAAGVLFGAAISIKYVALIALPFLAVRAHRGGGVRAAVEIALPAIALPVLIFAPLWPGWAAVGTLLNLGSTLIMSPQWLAATWFPFVSARELSLSFLAAFGMVFVYSLVRYARDGCARHLFRSVAALVWSSPLLNPWYVQWLLPAAATAGRWASYAWWFGLFALARYAEDAPRFPTTQSDLSARIALLEVVTIAILLAPIVLALTVRGRPWQRPQADDA